MFFFFSEELRRITRAPTPLTANTYDPAWLTDPTNPNYVPPALRDPNAREAARRCSRRRTSPAAPQFLTSQPTINNTRQEVVRVDYDLNPNYRLTGRYSHDNSFTEEPGGLFLGLAVPNVATTDTNVPGQVAAAILRSTHGGSKLNELQFQFSGNKIARHQPGGRPEPALRARPEHSRALSGNDLGVMPLVTVTGQLSQIGANQLYNIVYQQLHGHRQLHLAARHARVEVRRADDVRAEERERVERHAGQFHLRAPAAAAPRSTTS